MGTRGTGGRCREAAPGAHVCLAHGKERGAQPADPATRSSPPGLAGGRAPGWPPGDRHEAWNPAGLTRVSAREDSPQPRATHLAHTDPRRDTHAHHTYRLQTYTDHMRAQTHTQDPHTTRTDTDNTQGHMQIHADATCSQRHTTHAGVLIDVPTDTQAWAHRVVQTTYSAQRHANTYIRNTQRQTRDIDRYTNAHRRTQTRAE